MIKQIDTDVETFVINGVIVAYVHDMLRNILTAIDSEFHFVTFKVCYVNVSNGKTQITKVSAELINNDKQLCLDTLLTNLEIACKL